MPLTLDELNAEQRSFLTELFRGTGEDLSSPVSMYQAGERLGLDRRNSARVAETLLAGGLLELRSLSGAVALTTAGRQAAAAGGAPESGRTPVLGDGPVLDETRQRAVAGLVADLREQARRMGLDADGLSELRADLKTAEAQLRSPRPKVAVLRTVFESIRETLSDAGATGPLAAVAVLLGD